MIWSSLIAGTALAGSANAQSFGPRPVLWNECPGANDPGYFEECSLLFVNPRAPNCRRDKICTEGLECLPKANGKPGTGLCVKKCPGGIRPKCPNFLQYMDWETCECKYKTCTDSKQIYELKDTTGTAVTTSCTRLSLESRARKIELCDDAVTRSHCPQTCKEFHRCPATIEDSSASFRIDPGNYNVETCAWVRENPAERCRWQECGTCTRSCSSYCADWQQPTGRSPPTALEISDYIQEGETVVEAFSDFLVDFDFDTERDTIKYAAINFEDDFEEAGFVGEEKTQDFYRERTTRSIRSTTGTFVSVRSARRVTLLVARGREPTENNHDCKTSGLGELQCFVNNNDSDDSDDRKTNKDMHYVVIPDRRFADKYFLQVFTDTREYTAYKYDRIADAASEDFSDDFREAGFIGDTRFRSEETRRIRKEISSNTGTFVYVRSRNGATLLAARGRKPTEDDNDCQEEGRGELQCFVDNNSRRHNNRDVQYTVIGDDDDEDYFVEVYIDQDIFKDWESDSESGESGDEDHDLCFDSVQAYLLPRDSDGNEKVFSCQRLRELGRKQKREMCKQRKTRFHCIATCQRDHRRSAASCERDSTAQFLVNLNDEGKGREKNCDWVDEDRYERCGWQECDTCRSSCKNACEDLKKPSSREEEDYEDAVYNAVSNDSFE